MAIRGIQLDGILVLYKLSKPHALTHPDRVKDGWEFSSGGSSIYREEAREALDKRRIPTSFVYGGLSKPDRECVFRVLQQWVDGAKGTLNAE